MEILDKLRDVSDLVDSASDALNSVERLGETYEKSRNDRESGRKAFYERESNRYWNKTKRLMAFCIILWLFFIVATIVLCIQGNDIILRYMHI